MYWRICPKCSTIMNKHQYEQTKLTHCPSCQNVPLSEFIKVKLFHEETDEERYDRAMGILYEQIIILSSHYHSTTENMMSTIGSTYREIQQNIKDAHGKLNDVCTEYEYEQIMDEIDQLKKELEILEIEEYFGYNEEY